MQTQRVLDLTLLTPPSGKKTGVYKEAYETIVRCDIVHPARIFQQTPPNLKAPMLRFRMTTQLSQRPAAMLLDIAAP